MPLVKILIHAVWGTKNRFPFLSKGIKQKVIAHILENAARKKIHIIKINGGVDHLHCLFYLNFESSVVKAIQLIKGESSYWINKKSLCKTKFQWADEYFAVSVSESVREKVEGYIERQEEHHKKRTFSEEYEMFLKMHKG